MSPRTRPSQRPNRARKLGLGAQFGGVAFAHDIRVIRMSRHGASCPVGMGVSCSANRNIKAKITREGLWIEQMDARPGRLIPENIRRQSNPKVVRIDLNQLMTAAHCLL